MYVKRLNIRNIRSIEAFELVFRDQERAGWHVILGANGAGKSSVIRSLALALAGPRQAVALRQNWTTWARAGSQDSGIDIEVESAAVDQFVGARTKSVKLGLKFRPIVSPTGSPMMEIGASAAEAKRGERSIWGPHEGWFSASFGPFRRFSGGSTQFERLFLANPQLAPHLSAFGEDVALTEGLRWLWDLRVQELEQSEQAPNLLRRLIDFLNASSLLPHGARILEVRSEEVRLIDAWGADVSVDQMSDGYRSVLSMIFEILRQMNWSYGSQALIAALDGESGAVRLPGIVCIDEVDAHLHPTWQRDIGPWFTRCFPEIQFIVTTHSPIVCRNATSVWRLAAPGTEERSGRVEGIDLNRLIHGSILDAYGTEFFGRNVARSEGSKVLMQELAQLNRKALKSKLDPNERKRLESLRAALPTVAATSES